MNENIERILADIDTYINALHVLIGGDEYTTLGDDLVYLREEIIRQDGVIKECQASGAYDAAQHEKDKRALNAAKMDIVVLRNIVGVYEQALKRLGYELPKQ